MSAVAGRNSKLAFATPGVPEVKPGCSGTVCPTFTIVEYLPLVPGASKWWQNMPQVQDAINDPCNAAGEAGFLAPLAGLTYSR
jgi:hypothetical protein